jgi:hypothetical protein
MGRGVGRAEARAVSTRALVLPARAGSGALGAGFVPGGGSGAALDVGSVGAPSFAALGGGAGTCAPTFGAGEAATSSAVDGGIGSTPSPPSRFESDCKRTPADNTMSSPARPHTQRAARGESMIVEGDVTPTGVFCAGGVPGNAPCAPDGVT